ncbi:MAG: ATP-binding protein [Cellvibrionaceae bacterium]|nr:ATP-binding protein [Cellvibrionaceae bacterium]
MNDQATLKHLSAFVKAEHEANQAKLFECWEKPLSTKLTTGETQAIAAIRIEDSQHLLVTLGANESRFREGDMICLHCGEPSTGAFVRQAMIEAEQEGEWLLRAQYDKHSLQTITQGCYADGDAMDLQPFFHKALDDIAASKRGCEIILPLLAGRLDTGFIYDDNYDAAADVAEHRGLNDAQIDAVGKGVAAQYLACIQGPPGTGKTKVISVIAKVLADEGHSIWLTSHTHMAINNALNKVAADAVPVIKVGASTSCKGLDSAVPRYDRGDDWDKRPDKGYVIGATPFASCSARLENFEFDTLIFDEASQITVPLAVMAMRKAKRFIFVGDHRQLPPVVLSKSVLDKQCYSVFAHLLAANKTISVMLNQTYRMCADLCRWPSRQYYDNALTSVGKNAHRRLHFQREPGRYAAILAANNAFVFVNSPGINTRTHSEPEARLVAGLIAAAVDAGVTLDDIGVVTPYRKQAKAIRNKLAEKLGVFTAKAVVSDTVERMQGQERELMIISLCSTDRQFIHTLADFFFQAERLNVAITRARVKLILIGPELPKDFAVDHHAVQVQANIAAYRSLIAAAHRARLADY